MNRRSTGFTLIELMISVAIVAILARMAYSVYSSYVVRSNRALARTMLVNLAAKQEAQYLQSNAYATTLAPLVGSYSGGSATSVYINTSNAVQVSSDGTTIYQISITGASTTAYSLQAVAQGAQASRDKACTTLTLASTGLRGALNSGGAAADTAACWEK